MEKINESGLEILKGEKLVVVDNLGRNTSEYFDFCEGLLKKGYKIMTLNNYMSGGQGWKAVLSIPDK